MNQLSTLKMYAKNRKFPEAVKIGIVPNDWLNSAKDFANNLSNTSDVALQQREESNVKGTAIDNYDSLTTFYNQRYFDSMPLPSIITQLDGVHHLRFGVLNEGATIPFHIDEPFTLRFICVVQGSHKYHTETGNIYLMSEGEFWFINGSFKHSIENTSPGYRIALLGKFSRSTTNLSLINELLRA